MVAVVAPELGLGAGERVVVSCWLVHVGDEVVEGDRLVELLAGDVTFDVASPGTGRLTRVDVGIDGRVRTGMTLGTVETEE